MRAWLSAHPLTTIGIGLVTGAVAFLLTWGIWHLYQDHLTHHQMVNVLNQLLQQINAAKPQAPPLPTGK